MFDFIRLMNFMREQRRAMCIGRRLFIHQIYHNYGRQHHRHRRPLFWLNIIIRSWILRSSRIFRSFAMRSFEKWIGSRQLSLPHTTAVSPLTQSESMKYILICKSPHCVLNIHSLRIMGILGHSMGMCVCIVCMRTPYVCACDVWESECVFCVLIRLFWFSCEWIPTAFRVRV